MVTIGNVDQVMALVRKQLEQMARQRGIDKLDRKGKSGSTAATSKVTIATRQSRLQAIGSLADLPEEAFERVLVGALLSHEFGEDVARDARFQSLVDRTAAIMRADRELANLLRELRNTLPG